MWKLQIGLIAIGKVGEERWVSFETDESTWCENTDIEKVAKEQSECG